MSTRKVAFSLYPILACYRRFGIGACTLTAARDGLRYWSEVGSNRDRLSQCCVARRHGEQLEAVSRLRQGAPGKLHSERKSLPGVPLGSSVKVNYRKERMGNISLRTPCTWFCHVLSQAGQRTASLHASCISMPSMRRRPLQAAYANSVSGLRGLFRSFPGSLHCSR